MKFSLACLGFLGFAAALPTPRTQPDLSMDDLVKRDASPFEEVTFIGGNGGKETQEFFAKDDDGFYSVVSEIWVWSSYDALGGVKVIFKNNQDRMIGRQAGEFSKFKFNDGETVSELSLWGNGQGTRCGAFKIITSEGREFFPKMTEWELVTEYPAKVGSGLMAGVVYREGSAIDALGFVMVRPAKHVSVEDVTYPTLDSQSINSSPEILESFDHVNETSSDKAFNYTQEETKTTKEVFSISRQFEFGASISVSAGFPKVGEVETGLEWKVGQAHTQETETVEEQKLNWKYDMTIPAMTKVEFTAITYRDSINLPFDATMVIHTDNDARFLYKIHGTYEGVSYREVQTKTKETPL